MLFEMFAPKKNQEALKVIVPKEINIEVTGEVVIVRKGNDSVQIDKSTFKSLAAKNRTTLNKLDASFSAEYAYVSVFAAAKYASYPVVCIDRNKREIAWESLVEAFDEEITRLWFGPRWQRNSLAESRETIGVFGACLLGCYFEGFDKRTGKKTLQFSTGYRYHFP